MPRVKRKIDSDRTREGPLTDKLIRELRSELYLLDRAIEVLAKLYALRQGQGQAKTERRRS